MSKKNDLRKQREGKIINVRSSKQEKVLRLALEKVVGKLANKFPRIQLHHKSQWRLFEIVDDLKKAFPGVDFRCYRKTTFMWPDGGVLYLVRNDGSKYPILITEKKNQGTNDLRLAEGKNKQAEGNAIERLGKNVIGFRTAMLHEAIFPFVCFGDGCDFAESRTILDRVVTIAMFGKLNYEHLHNQGPQGVFNRGSFYFRVKEWTESEMISRCYSVAEKSVFYYFSKFGEDSFVVTER